MKLFLIFIFFSAFTGFTHAEYKIIIQNNQIENLIPETSETAGFSSCNDILQNGSSSGNGFYQININNNLTTVYCDMTTDGGGWTQLMGNDTSTNFLQFNNIDVSGIDTISNNSVKIATIPCDEGGEGIKINGTNNIPYSEFKAQLSWTGEGKGDQCENSSSHLSADGIFFDNSLQTVDSLSFFNGIDITKTTFQCECTSVAYQSGTATGSVWIR